MSTAIKDSAYGVLNCDLHYGVFNLQVGLCFLILVHTGEDK